MTLCSPREAVRGLTDLRGRVDVALSVDGLRLEHDAEDRVVRLPCDRDGGFALPAGAGA